MSERIIVADTSEKIEAYGLLALKGALKLEALGMKRRGTSAFKQAKSISGLTARSAKELSPKFNAWVDTYLGLESR